MEQVGLKEMVFLGLLGDGSFGRVYKALIRGEEYAVKVIGKERVSKLRQQNQVNKERFYLLQLHHPFLVRGYQTLQCSQNLYIIMEYVSGEELFDLLDREETLSVSLSRFYAAQLVLLLEYMHRQDIIYRDLKPENILVGEDGYLKVIDLGFTKRVLTVTTTLCGTPDYLAPEVITMQRYGKQADWYALGVVIYEMLLGIPPFCANTRRELYRKIASDTPVFPSYLDGCTIDLLERLMEKDPAYRLGDDEQNSATELKKHPWFHGLDWEALECRQLQAPPIPSWNGIRSDPGLIHPLDIPQEQSYLATADEQWCMDF